jgi:[ribosomal protein S18]-alanine N-acetyltransferase
MPLAPNAPTIRPATRGDISALLELDRASEGAAHWSESQYREMFNAGQESPRRLILLADAGDSHGGPSNILGFLVARHLAPEWELENIVVAASARRKGLGARLLDALLSRASATNSTAVFLEVRESNAAARALYAKAGFEQTGRRKSYYANPAEDAILYRRVISPPGA